MYPRKRAQIGTLGQTVGTSGKNLFVLQPRQLNRNVAEFESLLDRQDLIDDLLALFWFERAGGVKDGATRGQVLQRGGQQGHL